MDHKNPIDQWLKQSFEQTPPGDKDALWARVSNSLDQKKKKKRVALWWILGTAAVLGALALYLGTTDETDSQDNVPTLVQETEGDKRGKTNSPAQAENQNPNSNTTEPQKDVQSSDQAESFKATGKEHQRVHEHNSKPQTNKPDSKQNSDKKKEDKFNYIEPKPQKPTPPAGLNEVKWVWFAEPIPPQLLLSAVNNNVGTPGLLSYQPFDLSSLRNGKESKRDKDHNIALNNPWTIGFSAGFSPTIERVSIASDGLPYVHKNYLKLRNAGERIMFNTQFEFYIRKNLGNFFVQTGFSSMKRGFIQDYQYEINEIPIVLQFPGVTPDANGKYPIDDQAPYIIDPNPEKVNYQGKRTSSFSEIPLNLGYTINTGKLLVSPSIGAGVNFTQQSGGNTIDYQRLNIIPYQDLFKVNSMGYSFNTSVMLEYPLGKNLFLQAQPFYHRFLKGNTEVIQQKPISYGLNIGLNLKLQNNE